MAVSFMILIDKEILQMNYSPQAAKVGINPDTDESVSAQRVINSWAHELIRLEGGRNNLRKSNKYHRHFLKVFTNIPLNQRVEKKMSCIMCRNNMNKILTFIFFLAFNFSFAQTISNVQARQEGLEIIISYDMEGELYGIDEIMLGVSTDGGQIYKPVSNAEGDIGKHVKPGRNKEIYFLVDDALGGKNAKFKVYVFSIPPGMFYVAGGTFQMGSNSGGSDEKPIRTVTISSFFMDKTEVTQAQYRKVMGKNPSHFSSCDDCPVESVSWHDANEYAKKVGKRLPTEAEWEYAARGGNKSMGYKYAGSNNIKDVAWYDGNSGNKTHPVAQKQPNELGLYDMSGNVLEWCSDWYDSAYYGKSPITDPEGPNSGTLRVLRGGSWYYDDNNCQYYRIMPVTQKNLPNYQKLYNMFQQDSAIFLNSPDADFYRGKVAEYEDYLAQKEKAIQQQALQSQKNLDKVMGIQKNTGVAYRYGDDPDYRFNDLGFRLVHSQDSFPLE